jgi:hypothetical protein
MITGGAAAGMLPAALVVSVLCSAPFAGTTTAPLAADSAPTRQTATAQTDRPGGGAAALIAGEALLGAVGAGVVITVVRRDGRRGRRRQTTRA